MIPAIAGLGWPSADNPVTAHQVSTPPRSRRTWVTVRGDVWHWKTCPSQGPQLALSSIWMYTVGNLPVYRALIVRRLSPV